MSGTFETLRESLRSLDDRRLCAGFAVCVTQDRRTTAELLAFIDEIDRRGLWAAEGKSSMFAYCVETFRMSESEAQKRIWAARTGRRFPVLFEMVARGELHLSAIGLLAKHLTEENHRDVLARARHLTARQCELLVAEIAPQPDVPTRLVALPRRAPFAPPVTAAQWVAKEERDGVPEASEPLEPTVVMHAGRAEAGSLPAATATACPEASVDAGKPLLSAVDRPAREGLAVVPRTPPPGDSLKGRVLPLAPRRYKLELTIGQETRDRLTELQELLSHQIPDGDPAVIIDRALAMFVEKVRAQRMKATGQPRPVHQRGHRTRSVPAEVQRTVWKRDGGQCAFVGGDGQRCAERRFLEVHHVRPYAQGGAHTAENVQLRCRAHNQYEADRDYGRSFMDAKRRPDVVRETCASYVASA
jgi:hypothetical protein